MDITWIITVAAVAIIASAATAVAVLRQHAPRVAPDPERVARLRDRHADAESRRLAAQLSRHMAGEREARTRAPQRSLGSSAERVWAGGL